jgi:hypothetical protein
MPGLRAIPLVSGLPAKPGHSTVRRVGYQASEQEIVLVRDVSFDVAPGGIVCLDRQ